MQLVVRIDKLLVILLLYKGIIRKTVASFSYEENSSESTARYYSPTPRQRLSRAEMMLWNSSQRKSFQEQFQCSNAADNEPSEGSIVFTDVCIKEKKVLIKRNIVELACKPITKMVKLRSPGPNYSLLPDVAKVNRCSGFCNHKPLSCLPTKTSFIKIPVYQIDKMDTSAPSLCVDVLVEQHDECRCDCSILSKHCTDQQVYDKEKCACVCLNNEKKEWCLGEAEHDKRRYWDSATCSCKCLPMECPPSLVWMPELCRCVRVMIRDEDMSKYDMMNNLYDH